MQGNATKSETDGRTGMKISVISRAEVMGILIRHVRQVNMGGNCKTHFANAYEEIENLPILARVETK